MQKMGFNVQGGSDRLVMGIILVGIVLFIFNMDSIYNLGTKLRNGELFNFTSKEPETEEPTEKPKDEYEIVAPIGSENVKCTKTVVGDGGEKNIIVRLYYTDFKLKSIVEESKYDGVSNNYINYMYAEFGKYNKRKEDNLTLKGYSVVSDLSSTTELKIRSVIDLSRVNISDIKLGEDDQIELAGKLNQDMTKVTEEYANFEFNCEW